ncbi:MAG: APC family permease [Candidatus Lustribacter sp.]
MATADRIAAFGYKQELKRSLSLFDLLVYGLVFIVPITPVGTFGIVFNASHGMVPLVYIVGLVAMVFVALSYMSMAAAFPVAGSVYSYTSRSLGSVVGFFTGWAILLDYIFIPTISYVVCAIAIQSVFPAFSEPLCIAVMVVAATIVNYFGIETTARTSFVLLGFQLAILLIFGATCWVAIAHHVAGAHFSWAPLYNPAELTPAVIFGALSLAVLSFLGFDAISTLSEESRHGSPMIARATMLSLCVAAGLFIAQTWIASLFVLDRTSLPAGAATNAAMYDVAAQAGGPGLKFLLAVPGIFISALAGAVAAQAATARILFGMARDGLLPRALAHVDPTRKVPERALLLVSGVTLVAGIALAGRLELLASMVSFGALLGFLVLQVAVVVHFMWRERSRNWLRHLVAPAIGFAIIGYVLWNAELNAKAAGAMWMTVGIVTFITLRILRQANEPA